MVDPLVRLGQGTIVVTLAQVKLQAEGGPQRRSSSFSPAMLSTLRSNTYFPIIRSKMGGVTDAGVVKHDEKEAFRRPAY